MWEYAVITQQITGVNNMEPVWNPALHFTGPKILHLGFTRKKRNHATFPAPYKKETVLSPVQQIFAKYFIYMYIYMPFIPSSTTYRKNQQQQTCFSQIYILLYLRRNNL